MSAKKTAAAPKPPSPPKPGMIDRVTSMLDLHQTETMGAIGALAKQMPPPREARRVHLVLVEKVNGNGYSYSSEPKTIINLPGLSMTADEKGCVHLTADDCRRLARLLEALPDPHFAEVPTA